MPGLMRWSCRAARPAGTAVAFDDRDSAGGTGLLALLRIVGATAPLPLVAAGGIPDGAAVAAVLCAGASAAQVGTALMLAPEAGTHEAQRALLADRVAHAASPARSLAALAAESSTASSSSADRPLPARTRRSTTRRSPLSAAARQRGDAGSIQPLGRPGPRAGADPPRGRDRPRDGRGLSAGVARTPRAPRRRAVHWCRGPGR